MPLIAFIQQRTSESLHFDIDRATAAPCPLVMRERVKIVLLSFTASSVLAATTRARIDLLGALSLGRLGPSLSRHDTLILRLKEQNLLGAGHNSSALDMHPRPARSSASSLSRHPLWLLILTRVV